MISVPNDYTVTMTIVKSEATTDPAREEIVIDASFAPFWSYIGVALMLSLP